MNRRQILRLGLIGTGVSSVANVALAAREGRTQTAAQPAEPETHGDDVAIDDATALLYSRQAPLVPAPGLRDARAVWSHVPERPDRSVLVYLHGHNGYVTVDANGRPRVPDWAAGNEAAQKGASGKPAAPLVYGLDRLEEKKTGRRPIVLVPEDSTLATGSFWAKEPAGQYADPERLGRLVADCLGHLTTLHNRGGRTYLTPDFAGRPGAEGAADVPALDRIYLSGHSGAGLPMEQAAVSRLILPDHGVPADLWLFDCTYWSKIDGFVAFCARWKAAGRLAGGRRDASRFVCLYRPRTQTEEVADELRTAIAKAIATDPASLVVDHNAENLEKTIRPALRHSGAIFMRTDLPHDQIPTAFIPELLRTAAS